MSFYTDMLNSTDDHIPGLDDLNFPLIPHTQANTNDLPSESQDEVVEVQAAEVVGHRRVGKGSSHRTKKFDKVEDKVICSAWLNVSKDPIHGASQKLSSFWGRIRAYFDEHKKTELVRTENSIMHRWLTIQKEVNKFCSCYDKIVRRNASGATIQDMIDQAFETYTGIEDDKKSFTLLHCLHRLKDEEKWKSKRIELAEQQKPAAKKKQKTSNDSTLTPGNVEDNNSDEVQEVAAPDSVERKRPKGQKRVKEARRGGDDACIAALDKIWEKEARDKERDKTREASLQVEKTSIEVDKNFVELEKQLSNDEKQIEANLLKEEKDIMLADTSSLDMEQLQGLQIMRKKILARHMEN